MHTHLPQGFVDLINVAPTIIQDIRYFTDNNFVGTRIEGYLAGPAILAEVTARALAKAQKDFYDLGFEVVIYEAYRPAKATQHFIRWAQDVSDNKMQRLYYPRISKEAIFSGGYVSAKSAHTRGSAVDISLIPIGQSLRACREVIYHLSDGTQMMRLDDGTVDMGGHFDLLDESSWHDSNLVSKEQNAMRNLLRSVMEKHGFAMYSKEWWHYSFKNEAFPDTYFDFDIK